MYKIQKIIKPTLYKIQEIIRNIKRKKTPGTDNINAEHKPVNYPMALDCAQRHFKTVTARNLHFAVTLFVKEATKIVSEISLNIFVN